VLGRALERKAGLVHGFALVVLVVGLHGVPLGV
jgi:hypothetical protein